jgi:hypothetical protein
MYLLRINLLKGKDTYRRRTHVSLCGGCLKIREAKSNEKVPLTTNPLDPTCTLSARLLSTTQYLSLSAITTGSGAAPEREETREEVASTTHQPEEATAARARCSGGRLPPREHAAAGGGYRRASTKLGGPLGRAHRATPARSPGGGLGMATKKLRL